MNKVFYTVGLSLISAQLLAGIFPNDATRRTPTELESKYFLRLEGCSAVAITPDLILTAHHCRDYKNGNAMLDGEKYKFKVTEMLDHLHFASQDIMVGKIKWADGSAPKDLRYPRKISHNRNALWNDENVDFDNEHGFMTDPDFCRNSNGLCRGSYKNMLTPLRGKKLTILGVPLLPKYKAMPYSQRKDLPRTLTNPPKHTSGTLRGEYFIDRSVKVKEWGAAHMYLTDASSLNGNSGGPVYTDNYELVGLLTSGPDISEDRDNPEHMNRVSSLARFYPFSPILKKIYPDGINSNVSKSGRWIPFFNEVELDALENPIEYVQPKPPVKVETKPIVKTPKAALEPVESVKKESRLKRFFKKIFKKKK